jgi:hypothetical protein
MGGKMRKVLSVIILGLWSCRFAHAGNVPGDKIQARLYGFIKLETIYDNTEVVQGDWLLFARQGNSRYADRSIFTMNVRHSRLGLDLEGPGFGSMGRIIGRIEADFAGGFPNSSTAARQPLLRLRHAWIEIQRPDWELRMGQDWALIAGPFPNTTSFVVGAGKGNLWMRYPQIKYTLKSKVVKLAVSVNRPMGGNVKYEDFEGGDFDPVGDGERSGMPWWMARLGLETGGIAVSVSGHAGREKAEDLNGGLYDLTTFSANADLIAGAGPVRLTARVFTGENLNSFFGGVFQGVKRDSVSVSNIASRGGWAQAVVRVNANWTFTVGGGMDDPEDRDLHKGMRSRNDWFFCNVAWNLTPALSFMLEGQYLNTHYLEGTAGENLRLQLVTYWKF